MILNELSIVELRMRQRKAHIGETGLWPEAVVADCQANNIVLQLAALSCDKCDASAP